MKQQQQPHCMNYSSMSSLVVVVVLAALFSLSSSATALPHEHFLQCLSLTSNLSSSMAKVIYTRNDSSYASILDSRIKNQRFSTPTTPKPLVIVTPSLASHIQASIRCSKLHRMQIRIRSGGHDFEGLSYVSPVPFVVIDLINFRSIDVDVRNRVAWVQSGAILGELHYWIADKSNHTLAFPAGIGHTVGLGGHFSGGGYGSLLRKYGLAIDNIIDAQLIDAKGRILDRKSMGEDVFWAIRGGGGGSFGIVLAWKLNLVSVPQTVTVFAVGRTQQQNAIQLVHKWQYVAHQLPHEIFSLVVLAQGGNRTVQASFIALFQGRTNELVSIMQQSFPELGVTNNDCIEMRYIDSVVFFSQIRNQPAEILLNRSFPSPLQMPSFKGKSDFVTEPISETGLKGLFSRLSQKEAATGNAVFYGYGGIMDEIAEDSTPFPHRAGILYNIEYSVGWQKEDNINSEKYISWIRRLYSYMTPFVSKSPRQTYANTRDLDLGTNNKGYMTTSFEKASIWGRTYFKNNFDRLVSVKTMIDPENFFRHEQSIPPSMKGKGH